MENEFNKLVCIYYLLIWSLILLSLYFQIFPPNCFHLIVDWCVWLQLFLPQKVVIPERYMPDSDEESVTEEEKAARREKADKIKRILTQQRYATFHSRSNGMGWACIATG